MDEVEAPLKQKLDATRAEFASRFADNNPPDLRDLFYDVMSKMKGKPDHDANELAQQAVQAGGPLWSGACPSSLPRHSLD